MIPNLVYLIEPFYGGSHKHWVDSIAKYANSEVIPFTLKARFWKWRMAAAAIDLAELVNQDFRCPTCFLCSDMLDVSLFKSLLRLDLQQIPIVLYFHENQLTYPWNSAEYRDWDRQFAWRNFTSMLVSNKIIFNSSYHKTEVFKALPEFFKAFPENLFSKQHDTLLKKSEVVTPGIDPTEFEDISSIKSTTPRILWNHRWEHDKNPDAFFKTLLKLKDEGVDFELVVCGEQYSKAPNIFAKAQRIFAEQIVHWGYFTSRNEYFEMLKTCHVLPVTSNQEFFGLSVMEAGFCGVQLILPDRLSYPDLYAELKCIYQDESELYQMLKESIVNPNLFELPRSFNQYLYPNLIHAYEKVWSDF